ncbi:CsiV family protein [Colwellia psychrerythraea]|uniref:Uncharacterized protein n=1 Tax=Colwellia psychrerythraea TaxID=28229 RepID=A0A099KIQ4_COLPS|nr:CsiV family protein [Colwellia psychrerythraea]KGJ89877.1 Protein of unknown function DUF2803 [Colwellia psychrerythraea]
MKYPFFITSALTSLCLLTSHHSIAAHSTSTPTEEPARWFEIEIILFKHLSKKSENSEQFASRELSAKKRRAFDLLTPYLQPDISSLKQLLPNCQQPELKPIYDISYAVYSLWPEEITDINTYISVDEGNIEESEINDIQAVKTDNDSHEIASSSANLSVTELATDTDLSEQGLTQPSYQVQYADIELPVYDQYPSKKQAALCVIPADFFQQHLTAQQLAQFNIDGFAVDKLANRVNGIEQWSADENGDITWASEQPYLISQNSLRLKSIANRIKRSRNYSPVLHLGWRQIGETRRKAKAMQLYAGDNLALKYKQALTKQDAEQQALEIQAILAQRQQAEALISQTGVVINQASPVAENAAIDDAMETNSQHASSGLAIKNTQVSSELSTTELPIIEQLRLQAKQRQLESIFQQFALFDKAESNDTKVSDTNTSANDTNELKYNQEEIKKIVAQLSADINVQETLLTMNNSAEKQAVIKAPLQPWSIDGLFKVHLDHYLYINTELNMVEPTNKSSRLTKDKTSTEMSLNKNQVISFKQNRRVITGEIHYFDHPYIGMVVQIRRFDPTKPADEAVSQSKK